MKGLIILGMLTLAGSASLSPRAASTGTIVAPTTTVAPFSISPQAPTIVDLRGVTLATNPPAEDAATIANAPGGSGVVGGRILGRQARTLTWDEMKHGGYDTDGVHWSRPTAGVFTVEGTYIENIEDAIGPPKSKDTDLGASFVIRGVRAAYIRDDFLENDACLPGEVADVLVDGTHMFVSQRPGGKARCVTERRKELYVHDSVVWLHCTPDDRTDENRSSCPDGPGGLRQSTGAIFKWREGSGTVRMERVVIRVDGTPAASLKAMTFPEGSYEDVTIVWAGPGPYPAPVPPGVTVTTDLAIWERARTAWLAKRPPE